jgi:hypothetical protein
MLAFASDNELVDAVFIGETDGIAAGKAVVLTAATEATYNLQRPNKTASLPGAGTTAADFGGVLVFDEHMQSDENGTPGWADGRVGRILRPNRAGGRIYVAAKDAIDQANPVYMVKAIDAGTVFLPGDFTDAPVDAALTGVGAAVAGGTGDGTITATPTIPALTTAGVYTAVCIAEGVDGGSFEYFAPDGSVAGFAAVGAAFALLGTTITDGAADFVLGDSFTVTVTDAAVTVLMPDFKWVTDADVGGVAMIEMKA